MFTRHRDSETHQCKSSSSRKGNMAAVKCNLAVANSELFIGLSENGSEP
jgi:hypothetical protein